RRARTPQSRASRRRLGRRPRRRGRRRRLAPVPPALRGTVRRGEVMAPITTSIDVARPQLEVFDYVTDPTRFVEWQHGVVTGHMEGDGPHGVGDHCLTTRRIGFADRPVTSEITHIDPPRAWGVRGIAGRIQAIVAVS